MSSVNSAEPVSVPLLVTTNVPSSEAMSRRSVFPLAVNVPPRIAPSYSSTVERDRLIPASVAPLFTVRTPYLNSTESSVAPLSSVRSYVYRWLPVPPRRTDPASAMVFRVFSFSRSARTTVPPSM